MDTAQIERIENALRVLQVMWLIGAIDLDETLGKIRREFPRIRLDDIDKAIQNISVAYFMSGWFYLERVEAEELRRSGFAESGFRTKIEDILGYMEEIGAKAMATAIKAYNRRMQMRY